jgi:hypothetical protein
MSIELVNKNKIKADDYISVLIAINYIVFALFFHLSALVSIIVYPFVALGAYGVIKIVNFFNKRSYEEKSPVRFLFGIVSITVSLLFLAFILSQPNVTPYVIMTLISFPMLVVGFAGIIKGSIIDIYSTKHRVMTIILGFFTIVICLLIFSQILNDPLFVYVTLFLTLVFNIVNRAALYLSEFGLSIIHFKNFRIFFYIISNYLIYIDRNGNLVLTKL